MIIIQTPLPVHHLATLLSNVNLELGLYFISSLIKLRLNSETDKLIDKNSFLQQLKTTETCGWQKIVILALKIFFEGKCMQYIQDRI